ncbi:MAG TPA: pilus assembly protein TadB, partial [Sphingobium sp.]
MGNLLLLTVLMAIFLGLVVMAFSGPSADKASKRRVALIRERPSGSTDAILEGRMRRAISNRQTGSEMKMLVSLVPNPENMAKRLRMTGKKWTVSQYMTACAVIFLGLSMIMLLRDYPPLLAIMVSLAAGLGLPHFWVGRLIGKRIQQVTSKFPEALEL